MIENTSKSDVNVIGILLINTLVMKNQRWNNQSLHHICGQKDREKFNVTEDINKKIITQKQHDAFNIIM